MCGIAWCCWPKDISRGAAASERVVKQVSQRIERSQAIYGGAVSAGRPGGGENQNSAESYSLSGARSDGMRKDCPGELLRRLRLPGHLPRRRRPLREPGVCSSQRLAVEKAP